MILVLRHWKYLIRQVYGLILERPITCMYTQCSNYSHTCMCLLSILELSSNIANIFKTFIRKKKGRNTKTVEKQL